MKENITNQKGTKMEKKVVVNSGISTSTLLGIAFVVLKLCNIIDWSAPFWIPLALCVAFFAVWGVVIAIIAIVTAITSRY